jgi:hypothetical protein
MSEPKIISDKYRIQPHGLHSNNERYNAVQIAWAFN